MAAFEVITEGLKIRPSVLIEIVRTDHAAFRQVYR